MTYVTGTALTLALLASLFLAALHLGFRAPRMRERGTPADLGLAYEAVRIPTASGKQLFAWWLPVSAADTSIIILHGWGGNAELMLPMAQPFQQAGINVLLIDARNHGNSDADTFSSLPRFAEDLDHAIDWLRQKHPVQSRRLALLGHSVGAGAALLSASRTRDITAVISISAFAHPEWMMKRYLQRFHLPDLVVGLVLNYVQWIIGHRFSDIAPLSTVCRIDCPILLVHGRADTTVPVEDARAIAAGCPESNITLLEIDEAEHDSVDKIEQHGFALVSFLQQQGFAGQTMRSCQHPRQ
ncbi:alpha/beta hydrolase [Sedimenticola selenatireducens]|uniref:Alpha/beta hydrolase n=1 Tax=Sedimenticola selenatireducens TaxID=191960 RepID=A0A2N6CT75_9GAMM|nr:alpha/beta fold hydrolase [Sedimenticola selenatireducens]PLX60326.1 MAG: alpha/beta hydrolase [Sedimenticola selenatireducens]